jgi:transposase
MKLTKYYDGKYKVQAVKLAGEIGAVKAINELGIPESTLYTWLRLAKNGELDTGEAPKPQKALKLAEINREQARRMKQMEAEIREKDRVIECLKEATAFFAASRKR